MACGNDVLQHYELKLRVGVSELGGRGKKQPRTSEPQLIQTSHRGSVPGLM